MDGFRFLCFEGLFRIGGMTGVWWRSEQGAGREG